MTDASILPEREPESSSRPALSRPDGSRTASSGTDASNRYFWVAFVLLLVLALAHSLWATSLDGFTIDEPYHIAAGASYVRWGDFRLNPEHPPLVKLIAGAVCARVRSSSRPAAFAQRQRAGARLYTESGFSAERRCSCAGPRQGGLVCVQPVTAGGAYLLLRRLFGAGIALAALLLLALDPTVSAHMPVVMTDLPMALLGTIALCLAILALRDRRVPDWILLGIGTGLLLATKHSAPLIVLPLLLGSLGVIAWRAWRKQGVIGQIAGLAVASVLSLVVLWGAYGFHYHESPGRNAQGEFIETFNRPLALKIADLHSPLMRSALTTAQQVHLVPRAYIWGLADTLRAGVGRTADLGERLRSCLPGQGPVVDSVRRPRGQAAAGVSAAGGPLASFCCCCVDCRLRSQRRCWHLP